MNAQETTERIEAAQPVESLPWLGLFLFGCFLLAGKYACTQIWRKNPLSEKDRQQLREARRRLLQQLAALDEYYETGRLKEHAYQRERKRRTDRLMELTALYKHS